ncbi:MAG: hypothetical protein JWO22_951 [Frankiales bacterium]|nr:hypothetical protein [Frankiales bacterium]
MNWKRTTAALGTTALAWGMFAGPAHSATTATTAVPPTPATQVALPPVTTTTPASARNLASDHLTVGIRDQLLTTGRLSWTPTSGIPFDSDYQYISGPGPGTPQDMKPATILAFAKGSAAEGQLPVASYFRMDGNTWGLARNPAACQGSCTLGDAAKRNLDHLNDPAFMQQYLLGLVATFQALDAGYKGQFVLHVEPDLSGYGQMLSNDRARCAEDCIDSAPLDSPTAVRAAVSSAHLTGLGDYPDTMQGFFLAVAHLRDLYAPRVSLGYHVSGWATANVYRKTGIDKTTNDINQGTVPVDATVLGARVAAFAAADGAARSLPAGLPGPATTPYDLLFNDILDHDAGYAAAGGNTHYWWDTENIDLPNFARWESYLGTITSRTGLPATLWQIPLGNTVYSVENNTYGHYQDNRVQYLFDHLREVQAAGVTGLIFGAGNGDSTYQFDRLLDVTDNSRIVCTTLGSHSQKLLCPSRTASSTDDDGGYFRERATAYFAAPLPS